jgi:hypothetical protein
MQVEAWENDYFNITDDRVNGICKIYEELIELEKKRSYHSSLFFNRSNPCISIYGLIQSHAEIYQQQVEALTAELDRLYGNNAIDPVCQDLESLIRITELSQCWNDLLLENELAFNDLEEKYAS